MSEAKKLEPLPSMPRLIDDLPPISATGSYNADATSLPPTGRQPDAVTGGPRRDASKSSRVLARTLLVLGCVFVCFGLGVGLAALVLADGIDLKKLAWIKDLIRQVAGR